jgi:hypothetical protein
MVRQDSGLIVNWAKGGGAIGGAEEEEEESGK